MLNKLMYVLISVLMAPVALKACDPDDTRQREVVRTLTPEVKQQFEIFGDQLKNWTLGENPSEDLRGFLATFKELLDYRNKARDVNPAAINAELEKCHPSAIIGNELPVNEQEKLSAINHFLTPAVKDLLVENDQLICLFPQTINTNIVDFYNNDNEKRYEYLTAAEVMKTTDQRVDWAKVTSHLSKTSDYGQLSNLEIDYLIRPRNGLIGALRRLTRHMYRQVEDGRQAGGFEKLGIASLK